MFSVPDLEVYDGAFDGTNRLLVYWLLERVNLMCDGWCGTDQWH